LVESERIHLMKEISCRVVCAAVPILSRWGIPSRIAFSGVHLPMEYLQDPNNRIDWQVWAQICRNICKAAGSHEEFIKICRDFAADRSRSVFCWKPWLYTNPEKTYRSFLGSVLPLMYHHLKSSFQIEPGGTYLLSISIDASFEGCLEFFQSGEGVFAMMPTYIGLPPATVRVVEVNSHRGLFRIEPPASRTVPSLAKVVWRLVRNRDRSKRVWSELNGEIQRSYSQLERQAKEFRSVLEASGEAIAVIRRDRILWANPAMAALLSVPSGSSLIGTSVTNWISERELERVRRWAVSLARTKNRTEARLPLMLSARDGRSTEFSPPIPIIWAEEPAVLWQIADVTDRRALEQALAHAGHREQQRIAHDLHDGLGQVLTGAAFKARALETSLRKENSPQAAAASELVTLISEATGQARDLAQGLAPINETSQSLGPALKHLAATTQRIFGIHCNYVEMGGAPSMHPNTGIQLYRAVQEAVTNAIRHGKASGIDICSIHQTSGLELRVLDDGAGLPPNFDSRRYDGMGLRIMRYRVETEGGALYIGSRDDMRSGTQVTITLGTIPMRETTTRALIAENVSDSLPPVRPGR
jgi:signal transduction histidine kinase